MEQEDFRKLLAQGNSSSHAGPGDKQNRKRPFAQSARKDSQFAAMPPRRIKTSDPFRGRRGKDQSSISLDGTSGERQNKSLFAAGYVDRAKQRNLAGESSENQVRLDTLKDKLKHKEISHKEYLEQVQTLSSGEFSTAGMARGLDRKLLDRVRAGEDVLTNRTAEDDARVEDELERVLEQQWSEGQPAAEESGSDLKSVPKQTRNALLSQIRRKPSSPPEVSGSKGNPLMGNFKPLLKRNKDGTTTETTTEGGKKVKIIRDGSGNIIKKLVKKVEHVKVIHEARSPLSPFPTSKAETTRLEQGNGSLPDDGDIFSDVGEYDPFAESIHDSTCHASETTKRIQAGNYFSSGTRDDEEEEEEEEQTNVPTSAEDFLKRNKDALQKAAELVDKQSRADQERIAAKRKTDSGFGLVLSGDAYGADVRDVPEDDEMFDGGKGKHSRRKATTGAAGSNSQVDGQNT